VRIAVFPILADPDRNNLQSAHLLIGRPVVSGRKVISGRMDGCRASVLHICSWRDIGQNWGDCNRWNNRVWARLISGVFGRCGLAEQRAYFPAYTSDEGNPSPCLAPLQRPYSQKSLICAPVLWHLVIELGDQLCPESALRPLWRRREVSSGCGADVC